MRRLHLTCFLLVVAAVLHVACGEEGAESQGATTPASTARSATTTPDSARSDAGATTATAPTASAVSSVSDNGGWFAPPAPVPTERPEAHAGVTVGPPSPAPSNPANLADASIAAADTGSTKRDQIRNGNARAGAKAGEGWEQFKHDVKSIGQTFKDN